MPKIVDHAARRTEIAHALWRVIARDGLEGASVRVVAAEAGWSLGAVRHYFATQDELVEFATDLMIDGVRERLLAHFDMEPGMPRAQALLEELLPLDERRVGEVNVWLALLGRARREPRLAQLRLDAWEAERYLCRIAVSDVLGRPTPGPNALLEEDLESVAAQLHTVIDGLTIHGVTVPEKAGAADLCDQLRQTLLAIADRPAPAPAPIVEAGCFAYGNTAQDEALPIRERILVTDHWRVAHAVDSSLPGWLVVLPRTHVRALDELSPQATDELGRILHDLSAALREVVGCVKTYVMLFAEAEGCGHLHIHLVPRMPDQPADATGPRVVRYLGAEQGDRVPTATMDQIAKAVAASVAARAVV